MGLVLGVHPSLKAPIWLQALTFFVHTQLKRLLNKHLSFKPLKFEHKHVQREWETKNPRQIDGQGLQRDRFEQVLGIQWMPLCEEERKELGVLLLKYSRLKPWKK